MPKPKAKPKRTIGNLKWLFEQDAQAELIANAMLGQSNNAIRRDLEFTNNEINYALHKAKLLYHLPTAIRQGWRDGTNDVVRQVKADLIKVLAAEVQRDLPKLIVHPTPATVRIEDPNEKRRS